MSKMIRCKHCGQEIAASAKVCPYCGGKNKKPFYKKIWFWVLVVIIVIGVAGSSGGSSSKSGSSTASTSKAGSQSPSATTAAAVEYTTVDVATMVSDLESNAMKAKETYVDQYLEITGVLENIDSSGKYIDLEKDKYSIKGVQCYMQNDDQKSQVANMSIGDTVTLRGKCTDVGEVLGYTLKIDSIDGYDTAAAAADYPTTDDGYIKVSASELVNLVKTNALLAQNTFKDKKIVVTGYLSNIDSDGKYINIESGEKLSLVNIQCFIKKDDQKSKIMTLTMGDEITIKGTCTSVGELLGYSINIESIE